ncbi:MAG TPA: DUF3500 domain-containing protein [Candidatus Binataceae bacterium]|nr:DUF3500 domain-containing protein [Candidatus Binataceae bacterium]
METLEPRTNRPNLPAKHSNFPHPERLRRSIERAHASLAEPFVGISSDGSPSHGLFPLRSTGISPAPLVEAAQAWLATLSPSQRAAACFPLDSVQWRAWSNVHVYMMRHGVCLDDVDDRQKGAALKLVRAGMSAAGFESARAVMKLNEHIREITGRDDNYGEWYYWMSLFGNPSATQPWGWQLDGHHLVINCLVIGEQIVMTPTFLGSEPVVAHSGKYAGVRVLAEEEERGFAVMNALSPAQRARATLARTLPEELFAAAFRDNLRLNYEGIAYPDLGPAQQDLLLGLVGTYVGRMHSGHAALKLEEIKAHLPSTYFAWMGECAPEGVFYYRVHSPVILIEFDHQPGVALNNDEHNRNHIHTVVRTPNGNDYGMDLLRQHYERFDHSHPHTPHRLGKPS